MKSLQSLSRKRTLHQIKVSTNNCLLRLLYFKQNKKIHYLSTPLPDTKITFDSHTQRNSTSEKLPPMFKDHYSNNHLVTNVEKLLFEQNLTLISTEIKITGMIRYDKSFCPWPGCLLQSKRGLAQSSHSLLDGIKHWGTSLKLWHAESISWGIGYGITLLVSSLTVDPLLTLTSCSAVTVVDVAELDSPDVDGDTVLTGPESEDIFKTQKRKCRWGQMVLNLNCLYTVATFFEQLLFVQRKSPSLFCTWQYPVGLDGPWEAPWYTA